MKITIEHAHTKRLIDGSFRLCGSREDLRAIAQQVSAAAEAEDFTFGWVTIYAPLGRLATAPSKTWDE